MSRVTVPVGLKGKPLFDFLVKNKSALIATKKASIKYTNPTVWQPAITVQTKTAAVKAGGSIESMEDTGVVRVKVSCNASWFLDDQLDVLTDTCYDKSIADKGILIPHIADHIHTSTNHVGDVAAVYKQKISLKELGYEAPGATTCAIMETDVRADYNEKTYLFYKNGKINQHSIGLIYVSIGMCINDKDYLPEFELWNKYYDKIINKEEADERGYFWIVPEIKWVENSCVMAGSNPLTPTLEVTDTGKEAVTDTPLQPSLNTKSMVICPSCQTKYDSTEAKSNCPGCGQYVSIGSNTIETETFDLIKAIRETIFIK